MLVQGASAPRHERSQYGQQTQRSQYNIITGEYNSSIGTYRPPLNSRTAAARRQHAPRSDPKPARASTSMELRMSESPLPAARPASALEMSFDDVRRNRDEQAAQESPLLNPVASDIENTPPRVDLPYDSDVPSSSRPQTAPVIRDRPRTNVYGFEVRSKRDLARSYQQVSVPREWNASPVNHTRTQLLQTRKFELLPDATFDLDGDGVVGNTDLLVAKQFDADADGKLNDCERSNALQALQNGFLDQFTMGLDRTIDYPVRTFQVKGKVVNSDDFYPEDPDKPRELGQSRAEFLQTRKSVQRSLEQTHYDSWADTQSHLYLPKPYVSPPVEFTRSGIIRDRKRDARLNAGLTQDGTVTNPGRPKTPGLEYVAEPAVASRSDLIQTRKIANREDLSRTLTALRSYRTAAQRLQEREDGYFVTRSADVSDRTRSGLLEARKREMATISAPPAEQPPLFSETGIPFWTMNRSYVLEPNLELSRKSLRSAPLERKPFFPRQRPSRDPALKITNVPIPPHILEAMRKRVENPQPHGPSTRAPRFTETVTGRKADYGAGATPTPLRSDRRSKLPRSQSAGPSLQRSKETPQQMMLSNSSGVKAGVRTGGFQLLRMMNVVD